MKTTLLIAVLLLLNGSSFAQQGTSRSKLGSTKRTVPSSSLRVPDGIKSRFSAAYPDATVNGWQTEGEYYKVLFMDNSVGQVVVYDTSGKVVRKETELDGVNIPPTINEYYLSTHPEKKELKVWQSEDEGGRKSYSTIVKDEIIYFDGDGKYVKGEKRPLKIPQDGPRKSTRTRSK